MPLLDRITSDPPRMNGQPWVRSLRARDAAPRSGRRRAQCARATAPTAERSRRLMTRKTPLAPVEARCAGRVLKVGVATVVATQAIVERAEFLSLAGEARDHLRDLI